MNYKLKKVLFLPLSHSHMRGYMVSTIGDKQLVMNFFLQFRPVFLDFLPFPYYLFIGNENYQKL